MFKESLEVESSVETDHVVELTVLRYQGSRGRVAVSWRATATTRSSAVSVQPNNDTVCSCILLCVISSIAFDL